MALRNNYPGLTARNVGPTIEVGTGRKILMPPSAFLMGYLRRKTPAERRQMMRVWQDHWNTNAPWGGYFQLAFEQRVHTKEKTPSGRWRKRVRDLRGLPMKDLEHAVRCAERASQSRRLKAAKFWTRGGDNDLFGITRPDVESPYAGTHESTARVRSDSHSFNAGVAAYRQVKVTGLFGPDGHMITDAKSSSEDFMWNNARQGKLDLVCIDKHLAAFMDLAFRNPEKLREYTSALGTAFIPYDMEGRTLHEGIRVKDPQRYNGTSPPREVLLMDVIMCRLFEQMAQYDISTRLMGIPLLMTETLAQGFREGVVTVEAIPQGYARPDIDNDKRRHLNQMFRAMCGKLGKDGYELDGFTVEYAGTAWETIAYNFIGIEGDARVLFHPEYAFPPLVEYMEARNPTGRETLIEQNTTHPIAHLARRQHVSTDSRTRRKRSSRVEIPDVDIPSDVYGDYGQVIRTHYPGGAQKFKANVTARFMYGDEASQAHGRKLLGMVRR
jgi:hypothetical protein